jgi:transposase
VGHRSARLSVYARQLLVDRVIVLGKPVAMVTKELGVSRATGYKWLRRYRADGVAGLEDRSSRPARSPRALPRERVEAILAARVGYRYGPHRLAYLTGHPRSTIWDILRRSGMSRLDQADRLTGAPVRYVACHPGALLHQDHKKLGRIPVGGGHRVHGREGAPDRRHRGDGYDTSRSSSTTPRGSASSPSSRTSGRPARSMPWSGRRPSTPPTASASSGC